MVHENWTDSQSIVWDCSRVSPYGWQLPVDDQLDVVWRNTNGRKQILFQHVYTF